MRRLLAIVMAAMVAGCGSSPTAPSPASASEPVVLLASTPSVGETVRVAHCTALTGNADGPCVYETFGTRFSVRYDMSPVRAYLLVTAVDAGGRECLRGQSGQFGLDPGKASEVSIGPQRAGGNATYYRFSSWDERCSRLGDRTLGSGCHTCSPPFDTVALRVAILDATEITTGADPVFEAEVPARFHWAAR